MMALLIFRELPRVFAKYPVDERRFSTSDCAVNGRVRSLFPNARAAGKHSRVTDAISSALENSLTGGQIISVARGASVRLGVAEEDALKIAHSMICAGDCGIAVLYGAAAAQSERVLVR